MFLYTRVIKCVVVSIFEVTLNEATTSSYYYVWKVKARGRLVITAAILVLDINEATAGKSFRNKDKYV